MPYFRVYRPRIPFYGNKSNERNMSVVLPLPYNLKFIFIVDQHFRVALVSCKLEARYNNELKVYITSGHK